MLAVQLRWYVCVFLNATLFLVLLVATAMASNDMPINEAVFPRSDTMVRAGLMIRPGELAVDCADTQAIGTLGREGGLLSLLGIGGEEYAEPVALMVKNNDYMLRLVHNEQTTGDLLYIRADCFSQANGLTFSPGRQ